MMDPGQIRIKDTPRSIGVVLHSVLYFEFRSIRMLRNYGRRHPSRQRQKQGSAGHALQAGPPLHHHVPPSFACLLDRWSGVSLLLGAKHTVISDQACVLSLIWWMDACRAHACSRVIKWLGVYQESHLWYGPTNPGFWFLQQFIPARPSWICF